MSVCSGDAYWKVHKIYVKANNITWCIVPKKHICFTSRDVIRLHINFVRLTTSACVLSMRSAAHESARCAPRHAGNPVPVIRHGKRAACARRESASAPSICSLLLFPLQPSDVFDRASSGFSNEWPFKSSIQWGFNAKLKNGEVWHCFLHQMSVRLFRSGRIVFPIAVLAAVQSSAQWCLWLLRRLPHKA